MDRPDNLPEKREQLGEYSDEEKDTFSDEQINTFENEYVDDYEEVLEVLEEQDPHNPDPRLYFSSP